MIDPLIPEHRQRLSVAVDHSHNELRRFSQMRDNTVRAYLGVSPHSPEGSYGLEDKKYMASLPKGNLLQLAGMSLQIALAYGEPEYLCVPRVPEHTGLAEKLAPAINRMVKLLNLGETARSVAADSFFGYGIFKVGIGRLPMSAQAATGVEFGPCIWRVSQDNFIYDITAESWDTVAYVGDIYTVPLNDAMRDYPHAAHQLEAMTDTERLDAQHVLPRSSQIHSAESQVRLMDIYFPGSKIVATWVLRNDSFATIAEEPLRVMPYEGHWSGVYSVLSHVYSPDELVPVAQAESVKAQHFLFNDLFNITAEQARAAKVNPTYMAGAEKDMRRLWDAKDRVPVSVVDNSRFGSFEIPGPTQSQTAYMAAVMQMFKQFVPSVDEPQRAPTATQGSLIRETTNAVIAEARRKFARCLQLVGYKLGHLLLNNGDLHLPASKPLRPGSSVLVDVSWNPVSEEPRVAKVDDFDMAIEPYSTLLRTPEERVQQLFAAMGQIISLMQAQAQGIPINIERVLHTISTYMGLPEIKDWYEEVDPMHQAKSQSSRQQSVQRQGVGQYVRHNVSEQTTGGALEANLTQNISDEGGAGTRME